MHTEVKFTGLAQSLRVDPAVCIENPDRSLRVGPCSGSTLWISGHRCGFGAGAGSGPGSEGDFGASGKSCGAPSSAFGRTKARGERQVARGKWQEARRAPVRLRRRVVEAPANPRIVLHLYEGRVVVTLRRSLGPTDDHPHRADGSVDSTKPMDRRAKACGVPSGLRGAPARASSIRQGQRPRNHKYIYFFLINVKGANWPVCSV